MHGDDLFRFSFAAHTSGLPGKDLPGRNQFTLKCRARHILNGDAVA